MLTLSGNQWLTTPQSCQEHSCSLFFILKVWSTSYPRSSTARAVTDLMCCRRATRFCLGWGQETRRWQTPCVLLRVCTRVCVRARFVEHVMCDRRFCLWKRLQGKKQVGLWERYLESLTFNGEESRVLTVTSHHFSCVLDSRKNVCFGGVFFQCITLLLHKW